MLNTASGLDGASTPATMRRRRASRSTRPAGTSDRPSTQYPVDVRQAFDSVPRGAMELSWTRLGVPSAVAHWLVVGDPTVIRSRPQKNSAQPPPSTGPAASIGSGAHLKAMSPALTTRSASSTSPSVLFSRNARRIPPPASVRFSSPRV